jgi:hypothetical protein
MGDSFIPEKPPYIIVVDFPCFAPLLLVWEDCCRGRERTEAKMCPSGAYDGPWEKPPTGMEKRKGGQISIHC